MSGGTSGDCRWPWCTGCGNGCATARAATRSPRRASWTPRSSSAPIPWPRRPAATTAGRRSPGEAWHLAVDTEGWLLALVVTAASVSDKAGLKLLVIRLFNTFSTLKIMWADSGYDGAPIARWVKTVAAITLEVVRNASPHSFQVVRRRWVVERTFGWLTRWRRLVRDYERHTSHHEAMVCWATVFIMTRRLARYQTGQPPIRRWGGDRKRPDLPAQAAA